MKHIETMTLAELAAGDFSPETRFAEYARRLRRGEVSVNDIRRTEDMNPVPEPWADVPGRRRDLEGHIR